MKRFVLLAIILGFLMPLPLNAAENVSRDGYVFGGVVGSIAGFGIGHAIQKRYSNIGWAFTLGEGLGITNALTIPWIIRMAGGGPLAPEIISKIGWAIFVGFRLWQITDLWVAARPDHAVITQNMLDRKWQKGWRGAEENPDKSSVAMFNMMSW
jgi:hypothetical protein